MEQSVKSNEPRIFRKDASRKGAKGAKFGKDKLTADLR
jgi:hypothetical protein